MGMKATLAFCLFSLALASLQDTKNDIKSGKIPIHGVNLGGWLVAERWMTGGSPAWNGVPDNIANGGEYVTMKYLGHQKGDSQFDQHRKTFITEQDFIDIANAGLNTVRIPVGYWITNFDHSGGGDPYAYQMFAPGAIRYLDQAIREWALKHNILVFISMHAAKGSQNGNDNSAPESPGNAYWSSYKENVDNTLDCVQWLASRYKNDLAFLGIGLLNEPINQDENVLKQYYYDAVGRIRNDVGSDCLLSISPMLNEQTPGVGGWDKFMPPPNYWNQRHEWHKYFVWGFEASNGWNADKVINYIKTTETNNYKQWTGNWIYTGEWSLASSVNDMTDDKMHQFAQAQLDCFANTPGGWTFWTWKMYGDDGNTPNGWSMKSMIKAGFLPKF